MKFYIFLILSGLVMNSYTLPARLYDVFNTKNNSEIIIGHSKEDIPKRVIKYINKRKVIHGFYLSNPNQDYNRTSIITPKSTMGQLVFTGYNKKKETGYIFFMYGRSHKEYGCLLYEKKFWG